MVSTWITETTHELMQIMDWFLRILLEAFESWGHLVGHQDPGRIHD